MNDSYADAPFGSSVSNSIFASLHLIANTAASMGSNNTSSSSSSTTSADQQLRNLDSNLRVLLTKVETLPIFPSSKDSSSVRKALREDFDQKVKDRVKDLKQTFQDFAQDERRYMQEKNMRTAQKLKNKQKKKMNSNKNEFEAEDDDDVPTYDSPRDSRSRDRINDDDNDDAFETKETPNDADDFKPKTIPLSSTTIKQSEELNSTFSGAATRALRYVKSFGNFDRHYDSDNNEPTATRKKHAKSSAKASSSSPVSDENMFMSSEAFKNLEAQLKHRKNILKHSKNCFKFEASFRVFLWTIQLARSYLAILAPIYYEITELKTHWLKVVSSPRSFFFRWLVVDSFTAAKSWFHLGYLPILHSALDHVQNLQKMEQELVETIGKLHVALQGALFRVEEVAAQCGELNDALSLGADIIDESHEEVMTMMKKKADEKSDKQLSDDDDINNNNQNFDDENDNDDDVFEDDLLFTELHRASLTVVRHLNEAMQKLKNSCDNFNTAEARIGGNNCNNNRRDNNNRQNNEKDSNNKQAQTKDVDSNTATGTFLSANNNNHNDVNALLMTPIIQPMDATDIDDDQEGQEGSSSKNKFPSSQSFDSPSKSMLSSPMKEVKSYNDDVTSTGSTAEPLSSMSQPSSFFPKQDAEQVRETRETLQSKNLLEIDPSMSQTMTMTETDADVFAQFTKNLNAGSNTNAAAAHPYYSNNKNDGRSSPILPSPQSTSSSPATKQNTNANNTIIIVKPSAFVQNTSSNFFNTFIRQHCELLRQLQSLSKYMDRHLEYIRTTLVRRSRWSVRGRVLKTIGISFVGCGMLGLIWMNRKNLSPPELIDYYLKPVYRSMTANVRVYVVEPLVDLLSGLFSGPDVAKMAQVSDESDRDTYLKMVLDYHKDALQRDLAEARTMLALPSLDFGGISGSDSSLLSSSVAATSTTMNSTTDEFGGENNYNNNNDNPSSKSLLDDPAIRKQFVELLASGSLQQQAISDTSTNGENAAELKLYHSPPVDHENSNLSFLNFDLNSNNNNNNNSFDESHGSFSFGGSSSNDAASADGAFGPSQEEHTTTIQVNRQLTTRLLENNSLRDEVLQQVSSTVERTIDDTRIRNDYIASVRRPISGLIFGQLVRLLLIDLQRQKVGITQIMAQSDSMLRQQDLNFKIFAIMPVAMLVSGILVIRSLTKKSVENPLRRELLASWRALHSVVTRSSRFNGNTNSNSNNNNNNQSITSPNTNDTHHHNQQNNNNLSQIPNHNLGTPSSSNFDASGLFAPAAAVTSSINPNNNINNLNSTANNNNNNPLQYANNTAPSSFNYGIGGGGPGANDGDPFHIEMGMILLIIHRMKMLGRSLRRIKNEPIPPSQAWAIATARVASLVTKNNMSSSNNSPVDSKRANNVNSNNAARNDDDDEENNDQKNEDLLNATNSKFTRTTTGIKSRHERRSSEQHQGSSPPKNHHHNSHSHHQNHTMLTHVVITDWLTAFDNDLRELEDHRTSREQRLHILGRMVATYSFCDGKLDQQ